MRALVLDDRLRLTSVHPTPSPSEGEVVIRPLLAGICNTDLELVKGYLRFSGVPGHEFVGVIEEGDRAGERVVGEINVPCGKCSSCRAGNGNHCPERTVLGIVGRDGVFAEKFTLPLQNLHPVPANVPDEMAVFTEPLAAAFEIYNQTAIAGDDAIALLGDGKLGSLIALALAAEGNRPVLFGRHPERFDHFRPLGVDPRPAEEEERHQRAFDIVIEATGSPAGLGVALDMVKPRGRIILKSTVADPSPFDLNRLVIDEITLIGSRCGPFDRALEALANGKVDPRFLISDIAPFDDAIAAFDRAASPLGGKVLLAL